MVDWSGKKPLDYRKQKTTVSASTYSSEYNSMLPIIHSNIVVENISIGGTIPKINNRKKSNQRYGTAPSVHRSYSLLNVDKPDKYNLHDKANKNDFDKPSDSVSMYGSMRRNDKRNRSFLGRTFSSVSGKRHDNWYATRMIYIK